MLRERSLWTRLDVSNTSGVLHRRVTDALLRAAAAKACGALQALDVSGCQQLTHAALLAAVTANAGALLQLRAVGDFVFGEYLMTFSQLQALLQAAPRLQAFVAHMYSSIPDAHSCLRNEGEFAPVRLWQLDLNADDETTAAVIELARSLSSHAALKEVKIYDAAFEDVAALDALVDAAVERRLRSVQFSGCGVSPASAPSLARLLGSSALKKLHILYLPDAEEPLLDEPAAVLLASALQRNTTLKVLHFCDVGLCADRVAAATLLNALVAHPSVRELTLIENSAGDGDQAAVGSAIFALVAANAPALIEFSVSKCSLGDAGLAPLVHALQRNTHLKRLGCWGNGVSDAFAREQLLPAVRARDGLLLTTSRRDFTWDGARDAEEDMVRELCLLWEPPEEEDDD
jgi:hypothetical protein